MRRFLVIVLASTVALGAGACSSSKPSTAAGGGGATPTTAKPTADMPWPAPLDPMGLARKAGLVPETAESLQYHVHAHLDVFVNGKAIIVPGGIGIDITNPRVHSGDVGGYPGYGGINVPCDQPCISPLHTHDVTGVLHTESATRKNNTLGQFFIEWNVKLTSDCVGNYCEPATTVAFYVNGEKFGGDPNTIALSDHKEIAIVIGTPPAQIPSSSGI